MTSENLSFKGKFYINADITSSASLFGGRYSSSAQGIQLHYIYSTGQTQVMNRAGTLVTSPNALSLGTNLTVSMGGTTLNVNGTNYTISQGGAITNPYAIYVLATNTGGTAQFIAKGKVYYFQVYSNGNLTRDFVPVLDADGVPAMYDKIDGGLYYNEGSGTFKTNLDN